MCALQSCCVLCCICTNGVQWIETCVVLFLYFFFVILFVEWLTNERNCRQIYCLPFDASTHDGRWLLHICPRQCDVNWTWCLCCANIFTKRQKERNRIALRLIICWKCKSFKWTLDNNNITDSMPIDGEFIFFILFFLSILIVVKFQCCADCHVSANEKWPNRMGDPSRARASIHFFVFHSAMGGRNSRAENSSWSVATTVNCNVKMCVKFDYLIAKALKWIIRMWSLKLHVYTNLYGCCNQNHLNSVCVRVRECDKCFLVGEMVYKWKCSQWISFAYIPFGQLNYTSARSFAQIFNQLQITKWFLIELYSTMNRAHRVKLSMYTDTDRATYKVTIWAAAAVAVAIAFCIWICMYKMYKCLRCAFFPNCFLGHLILQNENQKFDYRTQLLPDETYGCRPMNCTLHSTCVCHVWQSPQTLLWR